MYMWFGILNIILETITIFRHIFMPTCGTADLSCMESNFIFILFTFFVLVWV